MFIDRAAAYAHGRRVFGRPIGQDQGVQFAIAEAHAETRAAGPMVREATRRFDAGLPCDEEASPANHLAA